MKVYQAIAAVTAAISHAGIGKDRKNEQQGYKFRGIDDVYNALSPMLAKHGLCILPSVLERDVVERQSIKGAALFYVTVRVRFDFVSAEDGSKHQVMTYGEAMDSGDKATNKAMSAAFKYACMQAFCIPTEGDNDADAQTHEVAARRVNITVYEEQIRDIHSLEDLRTLWKTIASDCKSCDDVAASKALKATLEKRADEIKKEDAEVAA